MSPRFAPPYNEECCTTKHEQRHDTPYDTTHDGADVTVITGASGIR